MNWKFLIASVVCLLLSRLIYYNIKRYPMTSEETNWKGDSPMNHYRGWGVMIIFSIMAIILFFLSFTE